MLVNLHIKNIVLINEIDIDFHEGLNILTGETGAGKSIVIGSLGICMGGRFSKELLRDAAQEGFVELTFFVDEPHVIRALEELEIEPEEDGTVVISRSLGIGGRIKNRINGHTVTTAVLKGAAAALIDLHAQHEQQTLLSPKKHLQILDEFAGEKILPLKEKTAAAFAAYMTAKEELSGAGMDEAERTKRLDYLEYQIHEIEAANLIKGEDEELEAFYKKAENAREILEGAGEVYALTAEGRGYACGEQLSRALTELKRLCSVDLDLQNLYEMLEQADALVSDFNRELKIYMDGMEFDEGELSRAETRLNTINGLKIKYGQNIEQILDTLNEFGKEREQLAEYETYVKELEKRFRAAEQELAAACDALSSARKKASEKLTEVIREALSDLNFMQVKFEMQFEKTANYTAEGNDAAVFMISTNVGEPLRPLHEIASGGELSRVMLAVKSTLATREDTPTLVFDEIDTGISGQTAQSVAKRLHTIATHHQVLCITHLPQIAAKADTHYVIQKTVEQDRTETTIRHLTDDESIRELARLLAGDTLTETALQNARELKATK